ncbi:MAG: YbjQ family protein [Deltaproteobacteria bacterium]|nr:YbjQ family protein [Deltaproteobacteria bacterium]
MLAVTSENIKGYEIKQVLGAVFGVSVRSRNVFGNMLGNLRSILGGSQSGFANMVAQTREEAIENMKSHAASLGANAVIMMRFDSSQFDSGQGGSMNEVSAYGTAVIIKN